MTKRKEERRELLKEDEIHSFLERVARYIQQNSKQVAVLSVVAFAALAAFFVWIGHLDTKRDAQAAELYKAEKILATDLEDKDAELSFPSEKARYEAALAELDQVIAKESGVVKQQAVLQKVGVLVHLGRQAEVEELYKSVISADQGLKVFGLIGLGDFYMKEGRYKEARDQYARLETLRGVPDLNDLVRYKVAVCYKEEGQLNDAKGELERLVDAYKDQTDEGKKPPIFSKAQQLLEELKKEAGPQES